MLFAFPPPGQQADHAGPPKRTPTALRHGFSLLRRVPAAQAAVPHHRGLQNKTNWNVCRLRITADASHRPGSSRTMQKAGEKHHGVYRAWDSGHSSPPLRLWYTRSSVAYHATEVHRASHEHIQLLTRTDRRYLQAADTSRGSKHGGTKRAWGDSQPPCSSHQLCECSMRSISLCMSLSTLPPSLDTRCLCFQSQTGYSQIPGARQAILLMQPPLLTLPHSVGLAWDLQSDASSEL